MDTAAGARRVCWAIILASALLASGVWLVQHRDLPWRLRSGDEMEYGAIARRISQGQGFTIGSIFPIEVEWGVDERHPTLLRAPLWPAIMGAAFTITGPRSESAHALALVAFAATAAAAAALGLALGGAAVGAVAGAATASSPEVVLYALFTGTETLFALIVTLVFLLAARGRDAFWIGAVCGLGYLTRFNGLLLLPVGLLLLLKRPLEIKPLARCCLGFALVSAPWIARNFAVTGDPLFSYATYVFHLTPHHPGPSGNLLSMLAPDLDSQAAMNPIDKLAILLPMALAHSPLLTANLGASVGVLLGAVRRDRLCLGLLAAVLGTTLLISIVALRGRYLIPFVPAAVAIGAFAWLRYGGRVGQVAIAWILAAPLLPQFPSLLPDTALARRALEHEREDIRQGGVQRAQRERDDADLARCLAHRPLVIAFNAAKVHWTTGALALWNTRSEEDFWTLVDEHPVEFVQRAPPDAGPDRARFDEVFVARPECGPKVFQRRDAADRPSARGRSGSKRSSASAILAPASPLPKGLSLLALGNQLGSAYDCSSSASRRSADSPARRATPASSASTRSVFSRMTSTGLPSDGASS